MKVADKIDAAEARKEAAGLMTGLLDYDLHQGGLFPGELIVLAARPGCGKTALATQIASNVAEKSLALYVSLEMGADELAMRLTCGRSGVSSRTVRKGRLSNGDHPKLVEAMSELSRLKLDIYDAHRVTFATIRREVRRRKRLGLRLVVVDYLQLVSPTDKRVPREQQVAELSKSFKELAREFEIPVLLLAQLNRQADGNGQPQLSHLRESGAIEQDADVVWFLAPHKPTPTEPSNSALIIAKNRNGEVGPLAVNFIPTKTRFECLTPVVQEWVA